MTNKPLSLDQEITYHIAVPGDALQYCAGWERVQSATLEQIQPDQYVTILVCRCDQAGLHGLLRKIYSKGLPLVSVICEDPQ